MLRIFRLGQMIGVNKGFTLFDWDPEVSELQGF